MVIRSNSINKDIKRGCICKDMCTCVYRTITQKAVCSQLRALCSHCSGINTVVQAYHTIKKV